MFDNYVYVQVKLKIKINPFFFGKSIYRPPGFIQGKKREFSDKRWQYLAQNTCFRRINREWTREWMKKYHTVSLFLSFRKRSSFVGFKDKSC